MRLNSTERSILEKHLLTKKGHNFFWRNPSSFAGLGIQYSKSGKYHIYRPDFLSIKNAGPLELNDEFWLYEPKGENQSDWKEKLTGLLQWKDKVEALAASQKRRLKVNISWFIQINKKQVVLLETSPSEPGYTPLSLAVISGITDLSSLQNLGSLPGLFKSISV